MPTPSLPDRSRRKLLGRAGQAAAAATTLAVIGPVDAGVPISEPAPAQPPAAAPRGYHETEHTRSYYRLARY